MHEESPQEISERLAERSFLGGPRADFERVGRLGLEVLRREGLRPSMRVLDVGCGALRVGYWLMPFLDPGCYFGIEPNSEMLNMGLEELVEPEVIERAQPRFAHNDDFDFSGFGVSFDFVFARSIWTHASKAQISAMLESFAMTSTPGGVFLTSYHPASAWFRVGRRWPPVARLATRLPLVEMIRALAWLPASSSRAHTIAPDPARRRPEHATAPAPAANAPRWCHSGQQTTTARGRSTADRGGSPGHPG